MDKKKIYSNKEQKVASDILTEYIIRFGFSKENENKYDSEFVDRIMKEYNLHDDPFTHLPCTDKEYVENTNEYNRQVMDERYGHWDGLD